MARAQAAAEAAAQGGASAIVVHGSETQAVVRVSGDDERLVEIMGEHGDLAVYRTATRHVLRHVRTWPLGQPSPGVTMLFTIHRRHGMEADAFHAWWERSHAPIALRHHVGMWDYAQVSVVETLRGDPWDGFAVTQWPTLDDLMHRFSSGPDGTEALRHDAAQFTEPATLRRHLLDERVLLETPWPVMGEQPAGLARSVELAEGTVVPPVDLPDGMSLEVRLTAEGRRRLDALWRLVVAAGTVGDVSADFDAWWSDLGRRLAGGVQPSSNS